MQSTQDRITYDRGGYAGYVVNGTNGWVADYPEQLAALMRDEPRMAQLRECVPCSQGQGQGLPCFVKVLGQKRRGRGWVGCKRPDPAAKEAEGKARVCELRACRARRRGAMATRHRMLLPYPPAELQPVARVLLQSVKVRLMGGGGVSRDSGTEEPKPEEGGGPVKGGPGRAGHAHLPRPASCHWAGVDVGPGGAARPVQRVRDVVQDRRRRRTAMPGGRPERGRPVRCASMRHAGA
jgi:hypothetical protein